MAERANLRLIKEAAAFLGFSYPKTIRLVRQGALPTMTFGGKTYVPDLEAWLDAQKRLPAPADASASPAVGTPDPIAELAARLRQARLAAKPVKGTFGRRLIA